MKFFILIFTTICFASNAMAQNSILLISPLVQVDERELPFELGNYKTFSKYYLENSPKEKNVESLLNEFENAQKYYLVKSNELARQYYEKVVSFSDLDEWKEIQRKVIFLSYIRLGELSPQNQDDWFLQALKFSLEIDPTKLNLSKNTLQRILELKKSFLKETITWQVSPFKGDFSYILINGHVIDLKKIETVNIPSGKFRVTFLSDIYKPQTLQVSSQQIPLLIPTRIPFVSGTCKKPFVNNEGEILDDISIYYSKDCITNQKDKKWTATEESAPSIPNFSTAKFEEPIYKKKWFLITLGVLASAAAVYMIDKNGEKKPTHETVNGF